jgi:Arc/MetJ-type ribon-helix-helix transcriptional regulator
MTTIKLVLPESLVGFVAAEATAAGHESVSEYVLDLIRQAQQARRRAALESQLLEGVESLDRGEGREMTPADWERLKAEVARKHGNGTVP